MIPKKITHQIPEELFSEIIKIEGVSGGDINEAACLHKKDGSRLFIKWNADAPDGMFEAEADGLQALKDGKSGLIIPGVIASSDQFLILEWIEEAGASGNSGTGLGHKLAELHKNSSDNFGWTRNNFIGKLPQSNTPHSNWNDFFAIERIEPMIKMGVENDRLSRDLLVKASKLYAKMGSIFPEAKPSLLHGDLWSGNYLFTKNGGASIFDPAVYYGHREMDIAMSKLFGGFSPAFYRSYEEILPMEPGFESRKDLYNLYPVLVHANLFGSSYARQAESIVAKYV